MDKDFRDVVSGGAIKLHTRLFVVTSGELQVRYDINMNFKTSF